MTDRMHLATLSGLAEQTGLSRTTIWRLSQRSDAPKPVEHLKRKHWRVRDWDDYLGIVRGEQIDLQIAEPVEPAEIATYLAVPADERGGTCPVAAITPQQREAFGGKYKITYAVPCPACYTETRDDCGICGGTGEYNCEAAVPWPLIQRIYQDMALCVGRIVDLPESELE